MGVGRGGARTTLDFENFNKKVVFVVSSGKKQNSPLLSSPTNILEKSARVQPGKNPSDAHGCRYKIFSCNLPSVWIGEFLLRTHDSIICIVDLDVSFSSLRLILLLIYYVSSINNKLQ